MEELHVPRNPLIEKRYDIPFAEIEAAHVEPAARTALDEARARLNALTGPRTPRTFENTLRELDELTERLDYVMHVVSHLESVATTPPLREAYNAILPEVSRFGSQLAVSSELWRALTEYAGTEEGRSLASARRRFLQTKLDDLRREGAHLSPEAKARLEVLETELSQLTTQFGENVLDDTAAFELYVEDERRLTGLPEVTLAAARADAQARRQPGWRLTLHEPIYVPVLDYADDAELRRALYLAYQQRATAGSRDNRPHLRRILELRREKAALLGYPTFADYVLEDRMAKTAETARRFLEDLAEKSRPFFARENEELQVFQRELVGASAPSMEPWDLRYFAEKLRRQRYDFDEQALRPYFAAEAVLVGLFEIARRVFGVTVREILPGTPGRPQTWHPDVRYFHLHDAAGAHVGSFYVDLHPRETKRSGAWMGDLQTGRRWDGGFERHLAVVCANVTPPVGDRPALLTHREVETLFHEFGHLLHHCLGRAELRSLSGTNVAWDFVELPSQILENWCWEREALDLFARHHQTGAPIPQSLLDRMLAARTFRAANDMMRQLGFATLDLRMHTVYDPARDGDPIDYARAVQQEFSPIQLRPDLAMVASFTHLFADPVGYAAGYYSYKWAEVLDADAFSRFQAEGIFNPETGRDFVEHVLSQGDCEEAEVLFRRFMGRGPDPGALLRRSGLVAEKR